MLSRTLTLLNLSDITGTKAARAQNHMDELKMNDNPTDTSSLLSLRNDSDANGALRVRQRHYIQAATANNTRRTYQSAIRQFERWGGRLPADERTVLHYLLAHADRLNPRTLSLRLTALRQWHRQQRFVDPTDTPEVRKTLAGIERTRGQPKRKARVFHLKHLETMVQAMRSSFGPKALRDRALLLVGFFGAFRRSELVGVKVDDLAREAGVMTARCASISRRRSVSKITRRLNCWE